VRDKDGISATVVVAELAASAKEQVGLWSIGSTTLAVEFDVLPSAVPLLVSVRPPICQKSPLMRIHSRRDHDKRTGRERQLKQRRVSRTQGLERIENLITVSTDIAEESICLRNVRIALTFSQPTRPTFDEY